MLLVQLYFCCISIPQNNTYLLETINIKYMKKKTIITTFILLLLVIYIGIKTCYKIREYKNYVEKTEILLDSIYVRISNFDDTIAETDVYSEYCEAYLELQY